MTFSKKIDYLLRKDDFVDQKHICYTLWAGMVVIRVEQGCAPTRINPNSLYSIDDQVDKIANTNITDHRSYIGMSSFMHC